MAYLQRMHQSLVSALAVVTVASAAMLGAAPAQADEKSENAYINALRNVGIIPKFYATADQALASGMGLCRTMDTGVDQLSVVDVVMASDGLPEDAASFVVGTATIAFCPWNSMNR